DLSHSKAKRFIHDALGYNYRLTSMQAALGSGQLKHIDEFLTIKRHMAEKYAQGLKGIPGLTLPVTREWATHVYWMYAILIDEKKFGMNKDQFRAVLLEKGIDTRDFFYTPCDQPLLVGAGYSRPFPVTERIAKNGCYLPSGLAITDDQIDSVCETIRSICPKV
ncbi:DegT/DnrJ/EryC1/StrS family aminotransferase, partial [Candidatus Woesebacteria bacterium]|nr:DegT/DnrJ/EryC1/StrS family aminotransferase [Candidatus Woesebacteria bacterium]